MDTTTNHTIYTIGHSTHDFKTFLAMLKAFEIKTLVDIRGLPGSRKYPQFDKENLEVSLPQNGINYILLRSLGGRRKVHKDSKNICWHNTSFQAYAHYMDTEAFEKGVEELEQLADQSRTAIMCAEAVWWRLG